MQESIGRWIRCNLDIPYTHDIISSVPYHMNNSINGYRSLIFRSEFNSFFFPTKFQNFMWFCVNSGDHDLVAPYLGTLVAPYLGTQAWIRSLNYSVIEDWRPWIINRKLAGYHTDSFFCSCLFILIKESPQSYSCLFLADIQELMQIKWHLLLSKQVFPTYFLIFYVLSTRHFTVVLT